MNRAGHEALDLKAFALLQELTEEEREALADLLEPCVVGQGEAIFCEGDEADGLVLIVSGSVRLIGARGDTEVRLRGGEHLGALSIFVIGARESSATAESECDLLLLSRMAFRRLADDAPRAACRLAEAVIGDLAGLLRRDLDRIAGRRSARGA
ncbi:MAG: cyclic nucleotide-binding domain-containing protein [Deltaproteobacteria bacterium]|nr:cyclic nucleotide-binding domain-containing protein [Deltaproteobacteria bacterium]MBW2417296.1 cyclic nucleotide-binding domain-containing protein [Deltaproteobacteria bacterium]